MHTVEQKVLKCNTSANHASGKKFQWKFGKKYPVSAILYETSGKISNDRFSAGLRTKYYV
jgi:hypothetical protein